MINTDKALKAFEDKLKNMSYEEREQYLSEMGFSFEPESTKDRNGLAMSVAKADKTARAFSKRERALIVTAHSAQKPLTYYGAKNTKKA